MSPVACAGPQAPNETGAPRWIRPQPPRSGPTTQADSASSIRRSLSRSPASIRSSGIPVQRERIPAICAGVTVSAAMASVPSPSLSARLALRDGISPCSIRLARSKSPSRTADSYSILNRSSCSLMSRAVSRRSFSDCQRAANSADCSSRPPISFSRSARRSRLAPSVSCFSASTSIRFRTISRSSASSSLGLRVNLHPQPRPQPRQSGRSPCPGETGPRCSGWTSWPRRQLLRPRFAHHGGPHISP